MSGKDKIACKRTLDRYVNTYFQYLNRDDYPDRPCVRKAVSMLQDRVFTLAEYLHELKIITFEECCEYWAKVGFVDEFNEECKFTDCGANIDGVCKYTEFVNMPKGIIWNDRNN